MGIKFNILSDLCLLTEDSVFSKFFTSPEPIKMIHGLFKISHDADLELSPTNNRHVLWDALREGKGIFGVIHKPEEVKEVRNRLNGMIRTLKPLPNLARTTNEIKSRLTDLIQNTERVTSLEYKKVESKAEAIKKLIETHYPDNSIVMAIDDFLKAIKPGEYMLVKRVPEIPVGSTATNIAYMKPSERIYRVRPPENKKAKIFGQRYIKWVFDGDKLIQKYRYDKNTVKVFNDIFPSWGERDYYIIDNKQFLRIQRHPFVSSKEVPFVEILPIETKSIRIFVNESLTKFERLINIKIKQATDSMKKKAHLDLENPELSDSDLTQSIEKYRSALKTMEQGIRQIDQVSIFREFLLKDTQTELGDYLIINSQTPLKEFNPYDPGTITGGQSQENWEIHNKQTGIPIIQKYSLIPTRDVDMVNVRLASDRQHVKSVNLVDFRKDPESKFYEMWDEDRRRWIPFDPKYIGNFTSKDKHANYIAIAFRNIREYNTFVRRFVLFAMRSVIKTPEVKNLENVLSLI